MTAQPPTLYTKFAGHWCDNCRTAYSWRPKTGTCIECEHPLRTATVTVKPCDQCDGLGWVRIKGKVYAALCGYETATECMACNPDGRVPYTGQINFGKE